MHFSFTQNPLSLEMSGPRVCVVNLQAVKNKKDTRRSAHAHIAYFHEIAHACRNARHGGFTHRDRQTLRVHPSPHSLFAIPTLFYDFFLFLLVNIGFFELPII